MENPFVVLVEAIHALDALGIDYVVVGSIASSIHGEYRASGDVDIVADVQLHHVQPLAEKLKGEFYVDDVMIRRAISDGRFSTLSISRQFSRSTYSYLRQNSEDNN